MAGARQPAASLTGRRRFQVRLLAAAGLVVVLVIAAWLAVEPLARREVVARARALGVELTLGEIELHWERIVLSDFTFRLAGVEGLEGHVERLEVELDGTSPTSLRAHELSIQSHGGAASLSRALGAWARAHPKLFELDTRAHEVEMTWQPGEGERPWLRLSGGSLAPDAGGVHIAAPDVEAAGAEVGPVQMRWTAREARASLGLGSDVDEAPIELVVRLESTPTEAELALRPTPLEALGTPFGIAIVLPGVTAEGKALLRFGEVDRGAVEGRATLTLQGYAPPMPREMQGIAFGKSSRIETQLSSNDARTLLTLSETRVTHGALVLEGGGTVAKAEDHAVVRLALDGKVACRELAAAAAKAHVGGRVGAFFGELARSTLRGTVAVHLDVEADSRELRRARMTPSIGVGCGLRGLPR